ncbi:MAG: TadG family pilus assembly protein [Pirellulales bacterium]
MSPRFRNKPRRHGNVLVLTAFLMIVMIAFVAMGVDIGYIQNARVELQKSADAAAMAAAWDLMDDDWLSGTVDMTDNVTAARNRAVEYAGLNKVCQSVPAVDPNTANSQSGDVIIGYRSNAADYDDPLDTSDPTKFNAVQVRVRRTSLQNGEVPLFFGRALGLDSVATEAVATAALGNNFGGFKTPPEGDTLEIMPFALDKQTWDNLINNGVGTDNWQWDASGEQVVAGGDGIKEVNLYPQGTGSPGNRGTVDVGGSNNSTADLARQIVDGVSRQDMIDLGKPLEFDANGKLGLNGDTGISAGVKDELASIKGKTRIIPIFESVSGNGNNATYTIVQWVGVRILEVKLTGSMSSKRVIIQPANVVTRHGVKNEGSETTSWYVYSPASLVR